jgi:hypothetical protein
MPNPITLFILKHRSVPGWEALAEAAENAGWNVRLVSLFESYLPWRHRALRGEIAVYGDAVFVTGMSRRLGYAVIGPPQDWFERFPEHLRQPWRFVRSWRTLTLGTLGGTPNWGRRYMVHVVDGRIGSISSWLRGQIPRRALYDSTNYRHGLPLGSWGPVQAEEMNPSEEERVRAFAHKVLTHPDISLPSVFGMTIGEVMPDHQMLVEHLYAAPFCPFVDSRAADLLPLLHRSCRPRVELSQSDQQWILRSRRTLLLLKTPRKAMKA